MSALHRMVQLLVEGQSCMNEIWCAGSVAFFLILLVFFGVCGLGISLHWRWGLHLL